MDSAPLHSSKPSAAVSRVPSPSPDPLVPPYWQHRRYESYASISTSRRAPIVLEDRTTGANDGDGAQQCATGALWAKAVSLDGYVVVKGNLPAAGGEYIVWNCTIETLAVCRPSPSPTPLPPLAKSLYFRAPTISYI